MLGRGSGVVNGARGGYHATQETYITTSVLASDAAGTRLPVATMSGGVATRGNVRPMGMKMMKQNKRGMQASFIAGGGCREHGPKRQNNLNSHHSTLCDKMIQNNENNNNNDYGDDYYYYYDDDLEDDGIMYSSAPKKSPYDNLQAQAQSLYRGKKNSG